MMAETQQILPTQDHESWHKRWEMGRIGWHKTAVDPVLEVKYINSPTINSICYFSTTAMINGGVVCIFWGYHICLMCTCRALT